MKARRQAAVLELIGGEEIRSQEQLRARLKARGFDVTQATLSRDIKDLGLVKRSADGNYQQQGAEPLVPGSAGVALQRALAEYASGVDCVEQLVVVRTGAGMAQPLAGATQVSVELFHYPVNRNWLKLWLNEFILATHRHGMQFLVSDWMALSRDIEIGRGLWQARMRDQARQQGLTSMLQPRRF